MPLPDNGDEVPWVDILAKVGAMAQQEGMQLEIDEDSDGQPIYRLTKKKEN